MIKRYDEYNEGIKSKVVGAGLASLLAYTPYTQAKSFETEPIKTEMPSRDGVVFYRFIDTISKSNRVKIKDPELMSILDDIKSHSMDIDSANYIELFNKLSRHLEEHYNYHIEKKELPSESSINGIKSKRISIIEILGWLGSICLAVCGMPQAWMSFKDKHSHGISWAFLLLWAFGECFALAYVYNNLDAPLLLNYAINIGIVGIILYYKIKPTHVIDNIEPTHEESDEILEEGLGKWFRRKMNSDEETAEGILRQLPRLQKDDIECPGLHDFDIMHTIFRFTLDDFNVRISSSHDPMGSDYYTLIVDNAKLKASKNICKKIFNGVNAIYTKDMNDQEERTELDRQYIRKDAKRHFTR